MNTKTGAQVVRRFRRLEESRAHWLSLWNDCYDFALPQRGGFGRATGPGGHRTNHLFDGTACDAVDQLAASLLAQLTPPWSRWFGLSVGHGIPEEEQGDAARELDIVSETLQGHFDRSNFAVEIHQCFLDLVTGGTASLLFEEAPVGGASAFKFTAVPLTQLYLEEGASGGLDVSFRKTELTGETFRARFPKAVLDKDTERTLKDDADTRLTILEAVTPAAPGYRYAALHLPPGGGDEPAALAEGRFAESPFINFRWMKAPGEAWGRSPVMKALPDIKTANKVVELILKNASIAVTGIWQAEDDGVINPANIRLVPGSIIPKAAGSAGLTPLAAPGRFDVSQLVLNDLRSRIRHALMADKLGQVAGPRMTATEILERSAEMARLLGATYGRLQSELLTPLVSRGLAILRRRKEIPDIRADGRTVALQYRSPLAQDQSRQDVQTVQAWASLLAGLGPGAQLALDPMAAAQWAARALGVPSEIVRTGDVLGQGAGGALASLADALTGPDRGAGADRAVAAHEPIVARSAADG